MDPRISTVESDVAAVRVNLEAIRLNYATSVGLTELEGRVLLEILKVDKKIDVIATELKVEFQKAVGDMRASMLATAIGLFATFGAMFIGIIKYLVP